MRTAITVLFCCACAAAVPLRGEALNEKDIIYDLSDLFAEDEGPTSELVALAPPVPLRKHLLVRMYPEGHDDYSSAVEYEFDLLRNEGSKRAVRI
ncbi:jg9684 [Pararge aegeria aegeria]|uniref:Jg9684 protein n=1 Tax=Pararge aegeria aegeria TaxID=348720 RepID=A0A8S4RRL4_9NEOP|nr:jg9684 [Pararge aegeria aegeria]